jgi:hypothetical protein
LIKMILSWWYIFFVPFACFLQTGINSLLWHIAASEMKAGSDSILKHLLTVTIM